MSPALEWVYGYRGKDTRGNLFSLPTGEVVYYVASLAVLYSPESQTQRHYRGHTDDIECLAVHPELPLCATGQASGRDPDQEDSAHVQVGFLNSILYTKKSTQNIESLYLHLKHIGSHTQLFHECFQSSVATLHQKSSNPQKCKVNPLFLNYHYLWINGLLVFVKFISKVLRSLTRITDCS